jgi:hypothetical protein
MILLIIFDGNDIIWDFWMNHNEAHLAFISGREEFWDGKKNREIERVLEDMASRRSRRRWASQALSIHPPTHPIRAAAAASVWLTIYPRRPIPPPPQSSSPSSSWAPRAPGLEGGGPYGPPRTGSTAPPLHRFFLLLSSPLLSSRRRGLAPPASPPPPSNSKPVAPATAGARRRRHLADALHLRVTSATRAAGGCGTGGQCACGHRLRLLPLPAPASRSPRTTCQGLVREVFFLKKKFGNKVGGVIPGCVWCFSLAFYPRVLRW